MRSKVLRSRSCNATWRRQPRIAHARTLSVRNTSACVGGCNILIRHAPSKPCTSTSLLVFVEEGGDVSDSELEIAGEVCTVRVEERGELKGLGGKAGPAGYWAAAQG